MTTPTLEFVEQLPAHRTSYSRQIDLIVAALHSAPGKWADIGVVPSSSHGRSLAMKYVRRGCEYATARDRDGIIRLYIRWNPPADNADASVASDPQSEAVVTEPGTERPLETAG